MAVTNARTGRDPVPVEPYQNKPKEPQKTPSDLPEWLQTSNNNQDTSFLDRPAPAPLPPGTAKSHTPVSTPTAKQTDNTRPNRPLDPMETDDTPDWVSLYDEGVARTPEMVEEEYRYNMERIYGDRTDGAKKTATAPEPTQTTEQSNEWTPPNNGAPAPVSGMENYNKPTNVWDSYLNERGEFEYNPEYDVDRTGQITEADEAMYREATGAYLSYYNSVNGTGEGVTSEELSKAVRSPYPNYDSTEELLERRNTDTSTGDYSYTDTNTGKTVSYTDGKLDDTTNRDIIENTTAESELAEREKEVQAISDNADLARLQNDLTEPIYNIEISNTLNRITQENANRAERQESFNERRGNNRIVTNENFNPNTVNQDTILDSLGNIVQQVGRVPGGTGKALVEIPTGLGILAYDANQFISNLGRDPEMINPLGLTDTEARNRQDMLNLARNVVGGIDDWTNSFVDAPNSDTSRFVAGLSDSAGRMLPTFALSMATGGGAIAGTALSRLSGSLGATGREYVEGTGDTYRALVAGGTEYASELAGSILFDKTGSFLSKYDNFFGQMGANVIPKIGEGFEENIAGGLSALLTGDTYTDEQLGNDFVMGSTLGSVFQNFQKGMNFVGDTISNQNTDPLNYNRAGGLDINTPTGRVIDFNSTFDIVPTASLNETTNNNNNDTVDTRERTDTADLERLQNDLTEPQYNLDSVIIDEQAINDIYGNNNNVNTSNELEQGNEQLLLNEPQQTEPTISFDFDTISNMAQATTGINQNQENVDGTVSTSEDIQDDTETGYRPQFGGNVNDDGSETQTRVQTQTITDTEQDIINDVDVDETQQEDATYILDIDVDAISQIQEAMNTQTETESDISTDTITEPTTETQIESTVEPVESTVTNQTEQQQETIPETENDVTEQITAPETQSQTRIQTRTNTEQELEQELETQTQLQTYALPEPQLETQTRIQEEQTQNETQTQTQMQTQLNQQTETQAQLNQLSSEVQTQTQLEMSPSTQTKTETQTQKDIRKATEIWSPLQPTKEPEKTPNRSGNIYMGRGSTGEVYETQTYNNTFDGLSSY